MSSKTGRSSPQRASGIEGARVSVKPQANIRRTHLDPSRSIHARPRASWPCRPSITSTPSLCVVRSSAPAASGLERRVTAHSGRVGLAPELTSWRRATAQLGLTRVLINDHPAMRKRRWRKPGWTGRGKLVRQGDVAIRLTAFACVGEAPMVHLLRRWPSARTYSSHDADSLYGGMQESERVAHFVLNQIREIVSLTISVEVDKDTSDLGTQLGGPTSVSAPAETFARRSFGSDPIFPAFKRDPARLTTLPIDVTRDNATGIGNACKRRYSLGRNVCDLTDIIRRQVRREDEHVR